MNKIQAWQRKLELKKGRVINGEEAARMLGVSYSYYTKLHAGIKDLNENLLEKMREALK